MRCLHLQLIVAVLGGAHGASLTVSAQQLKETLKQHSTTLVRHPTRTVGKPLKQALHSFSKSPTRANMLSGGLIFALGDVLAQQIERRRSASGGPRAGDFPQQLDVHRIASSASLGSVWNGLCSPQVYRFAESMLPGRAMRSILLKTAMTVGFLSTCGNYCNLLARKLLIQGCEITAAVAAINEGMAEVVVADLRVWPVWDIVQFACVPPTYRPVLTAAVCCFWSTYISMVAMRSEACDL